MKEIQTLRQTKFSFYIMFKLRMQEYFREAVKDALKVMLRK